MVFSAKVIFSQNVEPKHSVLFSCRVILGGTTQVNSNKVRFKSLVLWQK